MTTTGESIRRPVGVSLSGVFLLVAGWIGLLISMGIALYVVVNLFTAEALFGADWRWGLLLAPLALLGFLAYRGLMVCRALLQTPATDRRAGEMAMWACVPISWAAMGTVVAIIDEGDFDLFVLVFSGVAALFWSGLFVAGALYMRSPRVHRYFESQPT